MYWTESTALDDCSAAPEKTFWDAENVGLAVNQAICAIEAEIRTWFKSKLAPLPRCAPRGRLRPANGLAVAGLSNQSSGVHSPSTFPEIHLIPHNQ